MKSVFVTFTDALRQRSFGAWRQHDWTMGATALAGAAALTACGPGDGLEAVTLATSQAVASTQVAMRSLGEQPSVPMALPPIDLTRPDVPNGDSLYTKDLVLAKNDASAEASGRAYTITSVDAARASGSERLLGTPATLDSHATPSDPNVIYELPKALPVPLTGKQAHRVKLHFSGFPGGGNSGGCSGTLIAPDVVLTAAHCLYRFVAPGSSQNGFAANVAVQVSEPTVNSFSSPDAFTAYGIASSVLLGYTINGGNSNDIGLIRLSRPLGAMFGYSNTIQANCPQSITGAAYETIGYPGAPTPLYPNLTDAATPYQVTYSFSQCLFNNTLILSTPSHSTSGMSGSGAIYRNSLTTDLPSVVAVLAAGSPTESLYRYVDPSFKSQIDHFIAQTVSPTLDLMPVGAYLDIKYNYPHYGPEGHPQVRYQPTLIESTDATLSFMIHNRSAVDFTGDVKYKVYIGPETNIGEVALGGTRTAKSLTIPARSAVKVSTPVQLPDRRVRCPDEGAFPVHHISVVLDLGVDSNSINNGTTIDDNAVVQLVSTRGCIP
jgi:Trypsin